MIEPTDEMAQAFRAAVEAEEGRRVTFGVRPGLDAVLAIIERDYRIEPKANLTLAQAIETLPTEYKQFLDWMRRHNLGHGAGVGAVINAVRSDLRKLPGGAS